MKLCCCDHERGVEDVGVARIDEHVVGARVVVLEQDLLERAPAVGRAEDSALGIRAVRVAERGDEQAVGIAGIDVDRRDHLTVAQAELVSTSCPPSVDL